MKNVIKKILFSETTKHLIVGALTTIINIIIFRILLLIITSLILNLISF